MVKTPSDGWSSGKSCANRCDRKKEPALLMEDGEGVLFFFAKTKLDFLPDAITSKNRVKVAFQLQGFQSDRSIPCPSEAADYLHKTSLFFSFFFFFLNGLFSATGLTFCPFVYFLVFFFYRFCFFFFYFFRMCRLVLLVELFALLFIWWYFYLIVCVVYWFICISYALGVIKLKTSQPFCVENAAGSMRP